MNRFMRDYFKNSAVLFKILFGFLWDAVSVGANQVPELLITKNRRGITQNAETSEIPFESE